MVLMLMLVMLVYSLILRSFYQKKKQKLKNKQKKKTGTDATVEIRGMGRTGKPGEKQSAPAGNGPGLWSMMTR